MNKNMKLGIAVIISVILSLALSSVFLNPQTVVGPQGPAGESIVGLQGIQGIPGDSSSLSGTWRCVLDVDHSISNVLEVEIDSDIFIIQWSFWTEGVWDQVLQDLYFKIQVDAPGIQFEEMTSGKNGAGVMLLMGAGKYQISTSAVCLDRIWVNIRIYQLETN